MASRIFWCAHFSFRHVHELGVRRRLGSGFCRFHVSQWDHWLFALVSCACLLLFGSSLSCICRFGSFGFLFGTFSVWVPPCRIPLLTMWDALCQCCTSRTSPGCFGVHVDRTQFQLKETPLAPSYLRSALMALQAASSMCEHIPLWTSVFCAFHLRCALTEFIHHFRLVTLLASQLCLAADLLCLHVWLHDCQQASHASAV